MKQPREPSIYPNEDNFGSRENKKEKNEYTEQRELLYKQLQLLAEQSIGCMPMELAALSEQMVAIYSVLKVAEPKMLFTSTDSSGSKYSPESIGIPCSIIDEKVMKTVGRSVLNC